MGNIFKINILKPKQLRFVMALGLIISLPLIILFCWGHKPLFILMLHTWAMFVFSRTEAWLRISNSSQWRTLNIVIQIVFLIILLSIDYQLGLWIVCSYLLIAKILYLIFSDNLLLYTHFLSADRFDSIYWLKKNNSERAWKKVFQKLAQKGYEHSMANIIAHYLRDYSFEKIGLLPTILEGWATLRKYQILPSDLVLLHKVSAQNSIFLSGDDLLKVACNFNFVSLLVEKSADSPTYNKILQSFLNRLQSDAEDFVSKPRNLAAPILLQKNFEPQLEQFVQRHSVQLKDPELQDSFEYCYHLFYLIAGFSRNL